MACVRKGELIISSVGNACNGDKIKVIDVTWKKIRKSEIVSFGREKENQNKVRKKHLQRYMEELSERERERERSWGSKKKVKH